MGTQFAASGIKTFFLQEKKKTISKSRKMKMIAAFVLLCAFASSQALTWKSCGGSALIIKKLEVKQDPIVFPGPIEASLEAETTQDMNAPIKVELSLKKNGLTLPCIPIGDKMLGSCTYDDICQSLAKIPDDCKGAGILGDIIAESGLPCRCPPHKTPAVSVKSAKAMLPKVPSFIAFLAQGKIDISAKASDANGNVLGCVELSVNTKFIL